jgi:hypothetical protein
LNTEQTTTYDVINPYSGLGQAPKCGGVKLVELVIQQQYRYSDKKYLHIFATILKDKIHHKNE